MVCAKVTALVIILTVCASRVKGSCVMSGFASCCSAYSPTACAGSTDPQTDTQCYCDKICYTLGDCCNNIASTCSQLDPEAINYLPFFQLGSSMGVSTTTLPAADDGSSDEIPITEAFKFGVNSIQSSVYVITNGFLSFGRRDTRYSPSLFPQGSDDDYLVAPFWADIDISSGVGVIRYEVHTSVSSSSYLADVSNFIHQETSTNFVGRWLLLAEWKDVPRYSGLTSITNTFQAVVITSGVQSYALFTYQCGSMEWSGGATIGFNTDDTYMYFATHRLSGTSIVNEIACLNSPTTVWSNVLYQIGVTVVSPTIMPATALSPTSVLITWEPSSDFDGYVITIEYVTGQNQHLACVDFEYSHNATADVNVTEFVLTDLQEYTVYSFSVVAVFNRHGIEIRSDPTVGEVTTLQAAPGSAPQYLRDTVINRMSITVEWGTVVCIDRNSEIVGYMLVYGEVVGDDHHEELVPGTGDDGGMYTISGLSPYTNYSIEVAAVNSDSQTGPYAGIVVETLQDRPGLVNNLSVTPYPTSLQLSWSAPALPNGIIIAYQVAHYLLGSGIEAGRVEQYTTDISTTLTLTGLRPQTSYTVTVRAYTIAGAGEEASVAGTTEAVPKVQGILFAVINDSTVAVLWSPLIWSPLGVPEITAYIVSYSSTPEDSQQLILSSHSTSVVLHNLDTGSEYRFKVQAMVEIDGEEFFGDVSVITGSTNVESTSSGQSDDDAVVPITISVVVAVLIAAVAVTVIAIAWMVVRSRRHYTVEATTRASEIEMSEHSKSVAAASIPSAECSAYGTPITPSRVTTHTDDDHVYEEVRAPNSLQ